MVSLCPSRPSYGGKPGESSMLSIQLQQGGGGGGRQSSCCPALGRKQLLQLQYEGVKQAVLFCTLCNTICVYVLGMGEGQWQSQKAS